MWDQNFARDEYIYGCNPNKFLAEQAHLLPNRSRRTLTLGEGEGRNGVFLASLGHQVIAVDASIEGCKKAQRLAQQRGVLIEYQLADLANYQIMGQYDLMVMIFCHMPSAVRQQVHQQMVKHLAPGGAIIYQAYSPRQPQFKTGGPSSLDMLVSLDELVQDFSSLQRPLCRQHQTSIIEGSFHTGMADVVEMVAYQV